MSKRIEILDAIRGFSIIIMIGYHFLFDLVSFDFLPSFILYNPFMNFLQIFFAGVFIVLCGISSKFSKSNIKRGLTLSGYAILISVATYVANKNFYVVFGIIHFLAFCTLSYGFIEKKIHNIKVGSLFPIIMLIAFVFFKSTISQTTFNIVGLSIFGFRNANFMSSDYFPVLPWAFLFYIGIYLGRIIKENRFPAWFYMVKCDFLAYLGRKSLIIYVLHQPIIMGIIYAIIYFK